MKQWLLFLMMSIITSSICVESVVAQPTAATEQTTTPTQPVPILAEALSAKGITRKYYSSGRDTGKDYCSICDPFTFSKAVMESSLQQNLQDLERFYDDIADEKTTPRGVRSL
jgi:hypothetical protein